ncbi:hypothetical protein ECN1_1959 [Escherichia coli N1]|nr:hypothetical protein ECN1_1959 [Escherichia coli N1]
MLFGSGSTSTRVLWNTGMDSRPGLTTTSPSSGTSFLGNGIESRILFDQQRPDNIIEWSYARSDLKKQHEA